MAKIPVIVLSNSSDERDIQECYDAGANSYVVKLVSRDGFMDSVQRLTDFWFHIAVLPKVEEGDG